MDGYAKSMLFDYERSNEEINVHCEKCQLEFKAKKSDQFIKCKRCGEIFYLEEVDENEFY